MRSFLIVWGNRVRKSLYSYLLFSVVSHSASAQYLLGDTIFVSDTTVSLSDVTVIARRNEIKKADKVIYRVDPKDFVRHTQADNALKRIPNVAVTSSGIVLDNYKNAAVFIDGIESSLDELKRLSVEDIELFEVISNPSAIFGSERTGGVINVIRKKKTERFFMGEVEASKSVRLNGYSFVPNLSFKVGKVTTNAFYSFTKNNQNIYSRIDRIQAEDSYTQDNYEKMRGWQSFASLNTRIDFDPSNWLYLSGSATHYKFNHHYNGTLRSDDEVTPLSYSNLERLGKYNANLLYRHTFSKTSLFDVKVRYFDYSSEYRSEIDLRSKMREGSGEILYQRRAIDLWENPLDLTFDYKGIYRENFTGKERKWLSTQWIHTFHVSTSYMVGNVSGYASLSYDYMRQTLTGGSALDRHSVLPVASLLYKNPSLFDLSVNYFRKITRPSIDYLNPEAYVFSPLYTRIGNTNLDMQINNEVSFRLSRSLPNQHTLSLNTYHIFNNKVIGEVIREEGDRTFYSYDNIGKMRVSGVSLSWFASLPKSFYVNVILGPSYHKYAAPSSETLIRANSGWAFMSYVGVGTTIKDFLTIDLDYSYNSRIYQLVSTMAMRPMVNLNVEASLLEDKLKLSLYCMDLGGWSAKSRSMIRRNSFEQYAVTENNMMNFIFSVRYLFGKKFNNRSAGSVIENSDIITK